MEAIDYVKLFKLDQLVISLQGDLDRIVQEAPTFIYDGLGRPSL